MTYREMAKALMGIIKGGPGGNESSERTERGTVESVIGKTAMVTLDGAESPTECSTVVAIKAGDRVNVMYRNRSWTVVGNITDPSASGAEADAHRQHFWHDEQGAHVADGDGNELLTQGRGLRFLKDGAELLSLGLIDKDEKKPESDYSTYPQLAGGSCIYMVPKGTTVAEGETVCMVCLQNGMWYYVLFTAPFDMVGGDDDTCAWARWDFGYEWVYVTPAGGDVSDSVEVAAQVTNADVNALGLNGDLDVAGTVRAGLVDADFVRCAGEKVNGDSRVLGSVWASGQGRFDAGVINSGVLLEPSGISIAVGASPSSLGTTRSLVKLGGSKMSYGDGMYQSTGGCIGCSKSGIVRVSGQLYVSGGLTAGDRVYAHICRIDAKLNILSTNAYASTRAYGTYDTVILPPVLVHVDAWDYLALYANNSTGSRGNLTASSWSTYLTAEYVALD